MSAAGHRHIPPSSCSWCGHKPHQAACAAEIRTGAKTKDAPCPCARRAL